MSIYSCEECSEMFDDDYSEHLCEDSMYCPPCDERIAAERESEKQDRIDGRVDHDRDRKKDNKADGYDDGH